MSPKQVVITVLILNLILLGVFYVLTQTTIFDDWLTNKNSPDLCVEKDENGQSIFVFCDATEAE